MPEKKENINKNTREASQSSSANLDTDKSEYYIGQNRSYRIKASKTKDEVEGVGTVNFTQPLPQFDTAFGKAFFVTLKNPNNTEAYAIVLDKKYPIRLAEINKLLSESADNMVKILGAQIVPTSFSKGRAFVVVLEKPKGMTLLNHIKKNGPINSDYISRILVPALVGILYHLERIGVTHGKINASNIYVDESGIITLGECISEACGYSQPIIYETLGRASAMQIGKGPGDHTVDYYALGVLVAILLRGSDPTEGMSSIEILDKKFEEGTYKILTNDLDIPLQVIDLLRGTIAKRKSEIWNYLHLQEWIKGRRFNLLPPVENTDDGRAIVFNGKKFTSRKYLVHSMYLNWDAGKKFIKSDAIIKWISRSNQELDLVERLEMASGRYGKDKGSNGFDQDDQILAQYILLLDPTGPFRLKEISTNIDGLGAVLADAFATNKKQNIDAIENVILHNLQLIVSLKEEGMNITLQEAMLTLQKCFELLRKKDLGFGSERCLYELNPTLPCQSPQVVEEIPFINEELLIILDNNESIGGKILDRHMAAFISERMDLLIRIHISSLSRFPEFSTNIYLQVLALLSLVQKTDNIGPLVKLSAKIFEGLKNLLSEFNSKTIRNELEENLKKASKKGILESMLRVITDSRSLLMDKIGFKKALSVYKKNAIQIIRLSNASSVNNVGYRYGLQLAVMISFFVATVEIITLMIKAF